ncbi:hypothetical protein ACQPYK_01080 [Streptosporangium sp. CA-135522]|uniref:hypothetical protein n=1 Tax=Streptosporangium sp. CA-135522 TaxID=3240072 RepID=UPI003D8AD5F3
MSNRHDLDHALPAVPARADAYNCAPNVDPIHHWVTIRYRTARGCFYSRYPIDPETGKVTGTAARTIPHPSPLEPGTPSKLRAFGAISGGVISWIDLDNFSATWR